MQVVLFNAVMGLAVLTSVMVIGLILYSAVSGGPEVQKLAYGALGTVLGSLWTAASAILPRT